MAANGPRSNAMNPSGGNPGERLLALDIRPHWLGYAAFQSSASLLDFGVINFDAPDAGVDRFLSLLELFRSQTVVLRKIAWRSRRNLPATRVLIRAVKRECHLRSIPVVFVSEAKLWQEFRARGAANKREDAASFAQTFPELAWRVPPPRRLWQHEHRNMPIFDAVALATSHFGKQ